MRADNTLDYLRQRGWVGPGPARVELLGWGVSNAVLRVETPEQVFVLKQSRPQLRTRDGASETIRDLTSHPWAGARVKMTLVARDEAEQEGRSESGEVTRPAHRFPDPPARAGGAQRGAAPAPEPGRL